jgi:hypothetical protein
MKSVPGGELVVCAQIVGRCSLLRLSGMHGRRSRQENALVVANHRAVVAVEEVMDEEAGEAEVVVVMQEALRRRINLISSVSSASRWDIMPIDVQTRRRRRKLITAKQRLSHQYCLQKWRL